MTKAERLKNQKKIRKNWIKNIRSNRYIQGKRNLVITGEQDKFCCLGVLCDMAVRAKIIPLPTELPGRRHGRIVLQYGSTSTLLPEKVRRWVGLNDASGEFENGSLVELNDNGKTFQEIADIIESEPAGLFS